MDTYKDSQSEEKERRSVKNTELEEIPDIYWLGFCVYELIPLLEKRKECNFKGVRGIYQVSKN